MTTEHYHNILSYLKNLISGTEWEGHLFAVGGCCRDEIIGYEIKDIDLAVSLPCGGIRFAEWIYNKNLAQKEPVTFPVFGTAMLKLNKFPDDEIEIVQTRAEKYTNHTSRNPITVFGSIESDCRRRDLTINAIYYDISNEKMLDILGCSFDDIANHVIRTPDDPDITFDDDPVRILRAVRLASRYGWDIEPATYNALKSNIHRLGIVRKERMQAEFDKMLIGSNHVRAMETLRDIGAFDYLMPEITRMFDVQQNDSHIGTVWAHTMAVLDKLPPVHVLRMAGLFHDIGKTISSHIGRDGRIHFTGHERRGRGLIINAMRRMHYDSSIIDKVLFLVLNHKATKLWGAKAENMEPASLRRLQFRCGSRERLDRLLTLIDADNRSFAPGYGMPEQVDIIRKASAEMEHNHTAMFHFHHPFSQGKIRKLKGLGTDVDIKPYSNYLMRLVFSDPKISKEMLCHHLMTYDPGNSTSAITQHQTYQQDNG